MVVGSLHSAPYPQHSLPLGWERVRLGQAVDFQAGGTPAKSTREFWNGVIPFVTGADITNIHVGPSHSRAKLTEKGLYSGKTAVCKPGSVLLVTRTRVGRVGLAQTTMGASQDITVVESRPHVDPEYLCRYLLSIADVLTANCRGSTIQGLTRDVVEDLPIPLPPLAEQKRIVGVLNEQMAAVERAKKAAAERLEAAQALREALLNEAFREPTSIIQSRHHSEEKLGDACTIVTGSTPTKANPEFYGGNVPWVNPSHVGLSKFVSDSDEYLTDEGLRSARLVPQGAVLVVCISGSRSNIGKASIAERPLTTNQQINSIVPGPDVDSEFLYYHLLALKPEFEALAASTNQNIVNKSKIAGVTIRTPSLETQRRIAIQLSEMFEVAAAVETRAGDTLQGLDGLSASMLRRAFSGEV